VAAPLVSHVTASRRQPLTTEILGKGLRVFPLGKAEHHEVAVIAAQGVRHQCRTGRRCRPSSTRYPRRRAGMQPQKRRAVLDYVVIEQDARLSIAQQAEEKAIEIASKELDCSEPASRQAAKVRQVVLADRNSASLSVGRLSSRRLFEPPPTRPPGSPKPPVAGAALLLFSDRLEYASGEPACSTP
jgi:hypothetical protein